MQPQARHAEEVLDVVFPADDKARKVMQPGKESFHSPTPAVTPQRTAPLFAHVKEASMKASSSSSFPSDESSKLKHSVELCFRRSDHLN